MGKKPRAVDPVIRILRKAFDDLESHGEVFNMSEPPRNREEALNFLADEGQKFDATPPVSQCECAEHAKTARPGKWECLECGKAWVIESGEAD